MKDTLPKDTDFINSNDRMWSDPFDENQAERIYSSTSRQEKMKSPMQPNGNKNFITKKVPSISTPHSTLLPADVRFMAEDPLYILSFFGSSRNVRWMNKFVVQWMC
ncbi:hypothetical protein OUZ56_006092 [Daphnia magna]|uniref:Uncharacterized protein n=1 Tax=Daphnia magna TaxID=35525 RepID=A0ABQ9YUM0_9CRUS|nr:hypothetical protein OUZ56_006092 [Daphnia magna]